MTRKASTVMFLVSLLAALCATSASSARADGESGIDEPKYKEELSTLSIARLSTRAVGALTASQAACGTDAALAVGSGILETLPLTPLALYYVQTLFMEHDQFNNAVHEHFKRRGVDEKEDGVGAGIAIAAGAPLSMVLSGAGESLSNLFKIVNYEHATGVNYAVTRGAVLASYPDTGWLLSNSFRKRSSACRRWLWKLHQIALEAARRPKPPAPKQVADANGLKEAPDAQNDIRTSAGAPVSPAAAVK